VNIYRYVSNNPVNLWDPWGLCEEENWFEYLKDYTGGIKDFADNYSDMHESNWKQSDLYFHAKANFEAASRGEGGRDAAEMMSNARESFDQKVKGDSPADSARDQAANKHGRDQVGKASSSKEAADKYRPNDLPDKY